MELVLRAARTEFRKLGLTINESDFRMPPKPEPEAEEQAPVGDPVHEGVQ
jgi:hypothetical protein